MKSLLEWKQRSEENNLFLENILNRSSNHKELYFGFEVFDGKLIEYPEILFIGINPGRGNGEYGRANFETEQISYLDIFDENYRVDYPRTYHLAEKTIKFFRLIGWDDSRIVEVFSKNVVKTNFYHLATSNISDLMKVLNDIGYRKEYFQKSADLTMGLINLLKPKIIILEGKSVFQNVVGECYEKNAWTANGYGYYYDKENNSHLIGYSRGRNFSNPNRSAFVIKLEDILLIEKVGADK